MPKCKITIGERYGSLVVEVGPLKPEYAVSKGWIASPRNRHPYFKCRCEFCGKQFHYRSDSLLAWIPKSWNAENPNFWRRAVCHFCVMRDAPNARARVVHRTLDPKRRRHSACF